MPLGLIGVRALHFWSVAVLFGGGIFDSLIGIDRIPLSSSVLRFAAAMAALTGIAWFVLTFVDVTGGAHALLDPQEWSAFAISPFGSPWMAQLALDAAALALCVASRSSAFAILGALLALDQAWLGHAATGIGIAGVTMIASYATHVLAGLGWVGALTMLCLGLRSPRTWREGLRLFSTAGLLAVAAILASGCLNAAFHMRDLSDLWTSPYGRMVLCKLGLFALMLPLAVFNRREGRRETPNAHRLALGVGLETALGILILCVAGALGIAAPTI